MEEIIALMLPAFVACLILTGIHTYLGLHVVSRGVIFVDLALAQIAALGSTFAFLLGFEPKSAAGYFYSLGFAFLGAAIFSLSRLKDNRVPQEALIGITFAVASSAAILIADRAPQGAEHVEEMLTGAILWVSWPTIWKTLGIYTVVGAFHIVFRKKFLLISMDPEEAERQGIRVRWWDFLFYMSFGFVITSSVAIAGVLLVFSFLIIPSVIGMLYSERIGTRLVLGWASGTLVSLAGLYFSYNLDLPSGPAVVCTFGISLIAAALARFVWRAEHRLKALGRVAAGTVSVVALLLLAVQFEPASDDYGSQNATQLELLSEALSDLKEGTAGSESLQVLTENHEALLNAVKQGSLAVDQQAIQRIGQSGEPALIPVVRQVFDEAKDAWLQYYAAEAQIRLGDATGIHNMITLLKGENPIFLRSQALSQLVSFTKQDFGYHPARSDPENQKAINQMEVWWHQNADRLEWDPANRTFRFE